MPFKLWNVGEEVIAPDFNPIVSQQVIAQFPNAAARTAAITAPVEGMLTYLADVDRYETWNGTTWADIAYASRASVGELGAHEQFIISGAVGGTFTLTNNLVVSCRQGRRYRAYFHGRWNCGAAAVVQLSVRYGPTGTPALGTTTQMMLYAHTSTAAGQNGTIDISGRYLHSAADAQVQFSSWMTATAGTTLQGSTNDPWGIYVYDEGEAY